MNVGNIFIKWYKTMIEIPLLLKFSYCRKVEVLKIRILEIKILPPYSYLESRNICIFYAQPSKKLKISFWIL